MALLAAVLGGCDAAPEAAVTASALERPITTSLVAANITLDPVQVTMPGETPIRFELDNQDAGVPHGLAIMAGPAFDIEVIATEVEVGPVVTTLDVPTGLVAGAYRIICPVHPVTMTAALTVTP